jgi:hypothetical protein
MAAECNTAAWCKTLARMAFLAAMGNRRMIKCFKQQAACKSWASGTCGTYFNAIIELKKAIGAPLLGLNKFSKWITQQALVAEREMAMPLTSDHFKVLTTGLHTDSWWTNAQSRLRLVLALSWLFGHRPSDMVQLHRNDITEIKLGRQRMLHCIFRRGKTVGSQGPHSIHIPWKTKDLPLRKMIMQLMRETQGPFIFVPSVADNRRARGLLQIPPRLRTTLTKQMGCILHLVDPSLKIWSVRRGGLQRLATLGLTPDEIREHFSHHARSTTLSSYLEHHKYDTVQAEFHSMAFGKKKPRRH